MFKRGLGDTALVFQFPRPAARLFHTFFCPPLRILALSEGGQIIHDQVVGPNRFVRLPPTRTVIEIDPQRKQLPSDLITLLGLPQAATEGQLG